MKVYKESKFLVFEGEKDILKYDFSTESFIKNNKPIKHPQAFFRGESIKKVFEDCDEKYVKFIEYVAYKEEFCSNIGTFLSRFKWYKKPEQWINLGFNLTKHCSENIILPTDIPKDILKILKKSEMNIDYDIDKLKDSIILQNIIKYLDSKYDSVEDLCYWIIEVLYRNTILISLIDEYNYNYKKLIDYLDYVRNFEAYETNRSLSDLKDYAHMQHVMSKNHKFEKYPRYLRTVHDIVAKNFNTFKQIYSEEVFKNIVNVKLEHKTSKYNIIVPKCTQDIKDEGVNLRHCVASYIDKVLKGECQVVFLRLKEDESLVTVEVRGNKIVQAKGEVNRSINSEELEFLNKYAKIKNLEVKL